MNTNYLRELAEDLHSSTGYNPIAAALSLAADEIERIRSNAAALEDEKNTYMDYVGDALAQDDNETLWDAAQRVLSERDRLRAELAEWKQEWQTMETAPKDGSRILLATPSGKIADGFWSLEYRVWSWPYVMVEPTHWTRSLPIPGRKGEGE